MASSAALLPRATTQKSAWQMFRFATILTAVVYAVVGVVYTNYLFVIITLSAIEITMSSDNAVLNATYLLRMDEKWRRRFLFWGLPIAVLGMRLLIPILIVSLAGHMSPYTALMLALHHPAQYSVALQNARPALVGFGGAFLLMIALAWAFDKREPMWLKVVERQMARLSTISYAAIIVTLFVLLVVDIEVGGHAGTRFLVAGIIGTISYLLVEAASEKVDEMGRSNPALSGLVLFIFLEVLDASCSFDGVMGAFAITSQVIPIAIGLGVGALWVRSMSIYAVERGALAKFPFLDHGAHYAIFALAVLLFASLKFSEPDWLTGSIGLALIILAVITSQRYRKRHPLEALSVLADEIGEILERTKVAAGLHRIFLGVGWEEAPHVAGSDTPDVDVDANAIAFDARGNIVEKSWFGNLGSLEGAFFHTADDHNGSSSVGGDDERIVAVLDRLEDAASVVLAITIKSDHTLEDLHSAYARVIDAPGSIGIDELDEGVLEPLTMERVNLSLEGGDGTGVIVGRFYRKRRSDGTYAWAFQPLDEVIPVGRTVDDERVLTVCAAASTGNPAAIQAAQDEVLGLAALVG